MLRPLTWMFALGWTIWSVSNVLAQSPSDYQERTSPTLGNRLDKFGRDLRGIFTPKRDKPTPQNNSTAGAYRGGNNRGAYQGDNASAGQGSANRSSGRNVRIVSPAAESAGTESWPNRPIPERVLTATSREGGSGAYRLTNPTVSQPEMTNEPVASQPLYRRLTNLRQSAFDREPSTTGTSAPGEARISSGMSSRELDPPREENPAMAPRPELASRPTPYAAPSPGASAVEAARVARPSYDASPMDSPMPRDATGEPFARPPAENVEPVGPSAPAESNDDTLFARQSPILNVRTLGPRRISVGKESSYEVLVENLGQVAADNVVVLIDLPDWADVLGAEASTGATLADRAATGTKQFRWRVGPLAAHGREKIVLRIVPRQSRPIDLAVKWDYTPVVSQTVIEVQEPRLAMHLSGPREVLYAKKEAFKLEISNTGNGPAENVVLTLLPLLPGDGAPTNHALGSLPAGQKKVIEIEMTARETGQLAVRVELRCDGEIHAKVDEKILVRKAELQLAAEGPQMQFMGTVATYQFRVRNPGNAPARNVTITAKLPIEATFLEASHNGQPSTNGSQVVWNLDRLDEGAEQIVQMKCHLVQDGFSRIEVETAGEDDLIASGAVMTKVEAMADLALEVSDPPGPVPVGGEATYEIRIHNRGTKRASGVEVVAYFSRGIEPVAVEGSPYSIGPGQVVFDAIGAVPAGKEIVLKIKARADAPGNHMFRTEVYCRPLGTKLVGEETTHFYTGGFVSGAAVAPTGAPPVGTGALAPPLQTADRRNVPTVAPLVMPTVPPTGSPARAPTLAPTRSPAMAPPVVPTVTPIYPDAVQPTPVGSSPAQTGQPTLAPKR